MNEPRQVYTILVRPAERTSRPRLPPPRTERWPRATWANCSGSSWIRPRRRRSPVVEVRTTGGRRSRHHRKRRGRNARRRAGRRAKPRGGARRQARPHPAERIARTAAQCQDVPLCRRPSDEAARKASERYVPRARRWTSRVIPHYARVATLPPTLVAEHACSFASPSPRQLLDRAA